MHHPRSRAGKLPLDTLNATGPFDATCGGQCCIDTTLSAPSHVMAVLSLHTSPAGWPSHGRGAGPLPPPTLYLSTPPELDSPAGLPDVPLLFASGPNPEDPSLLPAELKAAVSSTWFCFSGAGLHATITIGKVANVGPGRVAARTRVGPSSAGLALCRFRCHPCLCGNCLPAHGACRPLATRTPLVTQIVLGDRSVCPGSSHVDPGELDPCW